MTSRAVLGALVAGALVRLALLADPPGLVRRGDHRPHGARRAPRPVSRLLLRPVVHGRPRRLPGRADLPGPRHLVRHPEALAGAAVHRVGGARRAPRVGPWRGARGLVDGCPPGDAPGLPPLLDPPGPHPLSARARPRHARPAPRAPGRIGALAPRRHPLLAPRPRARAWLLDELPRPRVLSRGCPGRRPGGAATLVRGALLPCPAFVLGSLPHWLYGLPHGTAIPPAGRAISLGDVASHLDVFRRVSWPILAGVPAGVRSTWARGDADAAAWRSCTARPCSTPLRGRRAPAPAARWLGVALVVLAVTNVAVAVGTVYGRALDDHDQRYLLPIYAALMPLLGVWLARGACRAGGAPRLRGRPRPRRAAR